MERRQDRVFALALGALLVLTLAVVGAALGGARGALLGAAAGVVSGAGLVHAFSRRAARRRRILATAFPAAWRELLSERYDHYDRLPDDWRGRFEDDLRIFLAEKTVTGVGVPVDDELRLLVAASAVTLSLAWPDYEWDQCRGVLLYPDDFDRDYQFRRDRRSPAADLAGQAHAQAPVILSAPALRDSFEDPDDAYHVGLHEFAHLLDLEHGDFGGIPAGLGSQAAREWVALAEKEMGRLRRGKSVLDPYGSEDPVEFFAVAVEAFFEAPLALRKRHRELYATLAAYFNQDPARWDDERGLVLD